jgi:hypothetical protein
LAKAKEVITPEQRKELLKARWAEAIARVTPEAIASGSHGERHEIQIAILKCLKQNMIFMCSRRAGKSEVCCGLLLLTAIRTWDVSCLYLGLTKDAAEPIWRKWKKLLKKFDIPHSSSDSEQFTEFANGSRVLFTGTDDLRRVSHLLGDQLAGGMAVIDEGQSDPGIMETTVEDTLGPMLDETTHDKPTPGRLVLSGTVPDAPVGYYWKTWLQNRNKEDTATREGSLWETWFWSRYENPFQVDNEAREEAYCQKYNRSHDDPSTLRRFRGMRVWSREANAYRFDVKSHCYDPRIIRAEDVGPFHCTFAERQLDCDRVIVGIQQAQQSNRFAIVAWTWNHRTKSNVYQLAEAVTDDDVDPLEHQWISICAKLRTLYVGGGMEFIRDSDGSSLPVNEALRVSHGIIVHSAIKTNGGPKARVQRLSDLLDLGIAKVIAGSRLSEDFMVSRWNAKLKKAKKWELDDTHRSPDVAKAAAIAFDLPSYTRIGGMKPPETRKSFDQRVEETHAKHLAELYSGRATRSPQSSGFSTLWVPPPKM